MSGNGGENAHNNQFGGRDRGPTGGIKGTSAPGGPGNSVTGGWGWSYNPGKGPVTTTLPDGSIAINITGGWSKTWGPSGNNGGNTGAPPGGRGGNVVKPATPVFNPDGTFDTVIDGFQYRVILDTSGKSIEVQQASPRSYTQEENLQVAVAKAKHKEPGEMFPELDFNRGEPERQQQAGQQAAKQFLSVPGAAERVAGLIAQQQVADEAKKRADAEKKAAEEAGRKAEEEARKHAEVRADAEQKLRSSTVMPIRGFPATYVVSLAPVRYSVAGIGSITLDQPVAGQVRNTIEKTLSEQGRLLMSNAGGAIGLGISLLFHSETLVKAVATYQAAR